MNLFLKEAKEALIQRPRRNRHSPAIRSLVHETYLHASDLIAPLFVIEGHHSRQAIASMPNVYRLSLDLLTCEVEQLYALGIRAVDLFAYIPSSLKDNKGTEAIRSGNLMQRAISHLKRAIPEMCIMADIALDPYTDHGHDGLVDEQGYVVNDATLVQLGHMALRAAEAGADIIAPSDMMDGRIAYLRHVLDEANFNSTGILSYAVKYASALYGPFRHILDSAPRFGDKKSYQLNPANRREALREALLDAKEGADMLMVKPATFYLDIISDLHLHTQLPIGAYHVSGEYAMLMAAANQGWVDKDRVLEEALLSIKRAGADFIFTYGARAMAEMLHSGKASWQ